MRDEVLHDRPSICKGADSRAAEEDKSTRRTEKQIDEAAPSARLGRGVAAEGQEDTRGLRQYSVVA